jgi:hypothetical protein
LVTNSWKPFKHGKGPKWFLTSHTKRERFVDYAKVKMNFQLDPDQDARRQCFDFLSDPNRLTVVSANPHVEIYKDSTYEVCTERNIEIVLQQEKDLDSMGKHGRQEFNATIRATAQKIYIAMLSTSLPMNLLKILIDKNTSKHGIADLPLTPGRCPQDEFRDVWNSDQFRKNQLRTLGYMLYEDNYDSVLQVLPYTNASRIGNGSIGVVDSVSLYNHLHRFPSAGSLHEQSELSRERFAVKSISERHPTYQFREQEFLKRIGSLNHRHISKCYAAFWHQSKYYMVSELATKDLDAFMKAGKSFGEAQKLKAQMRGLADAVRLIHSGVPGYAGYSHDIKLQNILVFENTQLKDLQLKLADWSCANMNPIDDSSHLTETFGSNTWCPPEIFPGADGVREGTSRPHDIWSLGCVFLELIVWFDKDWQAVQDFRSERREDDQSDYAFWMGRGGEKKLRPSVSRQIEKLRSIEDWSEFIDVIEVMLEIDPKSRHSADALVSSLPE